jgi:hypothetical protein
VQILVARPFVGSAPAAEVRRNTTVTLGQRLGDEIPSPPSSSPIVDEDERRLLAPDIADVEVESVGAEIPMNERHVRFRSLV